jgi:hypothetical protein
LPKEINHTEKLEAKMCRLENDDEKVGIKIDGVTSAIENEVIEAVKTNYLAKLKFVAAQYDEIDDDTNAVITLIGLKEASK